jgi:hypothetical protein
MGRKSIENPFDTTIGDKIMIPYFVDWMGFKDALNYLQKYKNSISVDLFKKGGKFPFSWGNVEKYTQKFRDKNWLREDTIYGEHPRESKKKKKHSFPLPFKIRRWDIKVLEVELGLDSNEEGFLYKMLDNDFAKNFMIDYVLRQNKKFVEGIKLLLLKTVAIRMKGKEKKEYYQLRLPTVEHIFVLLKQDWDIIRVMDSMPAWYEYSSYKQLEKKMGSLRKKPMDKKMKVLDDFIDKQIKLFGEGKLIASNQDKEIIKKEIKEYNGMIRFHLYAMHMPHKLIYGILKLLPEENLREAVKTTLIEWEYEHGMDDYVLSH